MPVLIVGSVALDNVKTPVEERSDLMGGSASYGAVAASFFEAPQLVGVVGSDFPRTHLDYLKSRKTDVTRFFHDTIAKAPKLAERLSDATLTGPATARFLSDFGATVVVPAGASHVEPGAVPARGRRPSEGWSAGQLVTTPLGDATVGRAPSFLM